MKQHRGGGVGHRQPPAEDSGNMDRSDPSLTDRFTDHAGNLRERHRGALGNVGQFAGLDRRVKPEVDHRGGQILHVDE